MKGIYIHLQFQEEDEEEEDLDGSEDGTVSPTASEDEQQEGNVYKWCKMLALLTDCINRGTYDACFLFHAYIYLCAHPFVFYPCKPFNGGVFMTLGVNIMPLESTPSFHILTSHH
jgi:hypothetical protein